MRLSLTSCRCSASKQFAVKAKTGEISVEFMVSKMSFSGAMEVNQRVRGGECLQEEGYAKQDGASRAKPKPRSLQSKIETLPRRMRAKSAHLTTFVDTEASQRTQTLPQRKSQKLGGLRLPGGEDDTPESERNLAAVPRTGVRYTLYCTCT